ncbi:hypothetical protein IMZ48_43740, partial [Candidatus Bathyarchaeota archaeon]|nr:hypothetical protein [Candidatus Bathyarchaeota archaeon]
MNDTTAALTVMKSHITSGEVQLQITPSQKAQLDEVADLMLEIYRTLACM